MSSKQLDIALAMLNGTLKGKPHAMRAIDVLEGTANAIVEALPYIADPEVGRKAMGWLERYVAIPERHLPPGSPELDEARARQAAARAALLPDIHLHGMWYRPDMQLPGPEGREKFLSSLLEAYLQFHAVATTLPSNVQAHLWLPRNATKDLLMPIKGPEGTIIEVPHSQLLSDLVHIHGRDELKALIDRQPEDQRKELMTIFATSLGTNIGLRSDLDRQLYGMLYAPPPSHPHAKQLNMHIDIDTLTLTREFARAKELIPAPPGQALEADRYLSPAEESSFLPRLRRQTKLRAFAKDVDRLRMPRKPTGDDPPAGPLHFRKVKGARGAGPAIEVPHAIVAQGYAVRDLANDQIAMVPQSQRTRFIAARIAKLLERTNEPLEEAFRGLPINDEFREEVVMLEARIAGLAGMLARVAGIDTEPLSQQAQRTYYRLAVRVLAARPLIQERIDKLFPTDASMDEALSDVLMICTGLTCDTVIRTAFSAQVFHHDDPRPDADPAEDALNVMSTAMFGASTYPAVTGSWLELEGIPPDGNQFENRLTRYRRVWAVIKQLLAATEAEHEEGDTQRVS